jgi:hypothetical protein
VAAAAAAAVLASCARGAAGPRAADAFRPLPAGFRYLPTERPVARATSASLRQAAGATDAATTTVATPLQAAPAGLRLVALRFATAPSCDALAARLAAKVPLEGARSEALAGDRVLVHDADATLASAALWCHGPLALVAYGSTVAEAEAVLAPLIASDR